MKQTIRDTPVRGSRVFLRVDFNVPLENSSVADDHRILASLPTIKYLSEAGGRIFCASHLGRPGGTHSPGLSLAPVAQVLSRHLGKPVTFIPACKGSVVTQHAGSMKEGDIALLENLRFEPGEESNDSAFASQLADPMDMYVNDAFGTAHRAHASTAAITRYLSPAVAGFLLESEIKSLSQLLVNEQHPYLAVLGGAKISGKIELMESLMDRVDTILVGGAMAYTFLRAQGIGTGNSLVEEDRIEVAARILAKAREQGVDLLLPMDHVVAPGLEEGVVAITEDAGIPAGNLAGDIGPRTVAAYTERIATAATILWNGPMGVFEADRFSQGTRDVGEAIASATAFSVVGGGDSAAAVRRFNLGDRFSHISTGGGASLEYLSGRTLPGLAALDGQVTKS
jgi:3-phosphoglycerate kinase